MHQRVNHYQSILSGLPRDVVGFSAARAIKFDESFKTRGKPSKDGEIEEVAPRLIREKTAQAELVSEERKKIVIKEFAKGEFTVSDVAKKLDVSSDTARMLLKKIVTSGDTTLREEKIVGSGGALAFRFDGKPFTRSAEALQKLIMTAARKHSKSGSWFRAAELVDAVKFYIYSRKYKIELIKTVLKESGKFDFAVRKCPEGDKVFVFKRKGAVK